ncbi:MAG TPA: glutathione S-transferase family protein [Gammaproteobacteria bacterium]
MSEGLVFYHNPMSRGRIVHWMLEEIGVPYEVRLLSFERGEHKAPEFLALNPMGKIPTVVHDGTVVTEAAAICAYLADAFPSAGLAPPASSSQRGPYYRWLFFGAGCVEAALVDRMLSRPAAQRSVTIGYGTYEDTLNALERAITPGPYILGERFSAADVYIASEIGWGLYTKTLEPRPAFVEYSERCRSRPAAKRCEERDQKFAAELQARG